MSASVVDPALGQPRPGGAAPGGPGAAGAGEVRTPARLSEAAERAFAREIAKYPPEGKASAVIACLAILQKEHGFISLESEEIVVAGRHAMQTRVLWTAQNATIEQTMVHLDPADEDTSVMTVTCTSSLDAAASIWPVFERLVASLQPAAQRSPSGSYAQASAGWAKR